MNGLLVIGASYAGIQAALTARECGYQERITVVADETSLPYQRPPLSKGFLLDEVKQSDLVIRNEGFFDRNRIELVPGVRITGIDRLARTAARVGGSPLCFDKLLIATGSRARRLQVAGADLDGVCYLRSIDDALELKARMGNATHVVVIGGGFIGLEVAASAAKLGKKVSVLEMAPRLLERAVSPIVSQFLLDLHLAHGVDVRPDETVTSIEGAAGRAVAVHGGSGIRLPADLVLVGIGGIANDELAEAIGLERRNGIVVDDHGRTSEPEMFAAGDCAMHFNPFARDWVRLESVQNAQDQAKAAGTALSGRIGPYQSVPRFWSDQYEVKLQMVGLSRGFDRHAIRGSIESGRFTVFYYKGNVLIAADGINRPGEQLVARRMIAEGVSPTPAQAEDLSFDLKSALATAVGSHG